MALFTAEITAFNDDVEVFASIPTPHNTRSPTVHSTKAAARASPPSERACSE